MDILESLTADFDRLRDLTIDFTIAPEGQRDQIFRALVRYQDVTLKAQASIMAMENLKFAKRKMLERSDVMEEIATSINRTSRLEIREAKMDLYSDLVIQRISDCEREVIPFIFENLNETERRNLGSKYAKYRDIALDHEIPRAV